MQKAVLIALMLVVGSAGFASSSAGFTGGLGDGYAHGDFLTLPETSLASHFLGGVHNGYSSSQWRTFQPATDPAQARFAGNGYDGYASARFISTWPQIPRKQFSGGGFDGYASSKQLSPLGQTKRSQFSGGSFDGYASSKQLSLWQQTQPGRFLGGSFDGYDRQAILGLPNWTLGDTDGNGLPDWWELNYFGVLTGTDPNGDADHDGASNLFEYLTGTNPTNPISCFHITHLTPGSPNKIFVYCMPGYFYTLQQANNLALGWTVVSNQTRISPTSEGVLEMDDLFGGTSGFYRILLEY
jgi:hypothetical protein